jgi:hypothetical protein
VIRLLTTIRLDIRTKLVMRLTRERTTADFSQAHAKIIG